MNCAYIHLSTHPFPVTSAFFGQTFVISSLLRKMVDYPEVSFSQVWCANRPPIPEQLIDEYMNFSRMAVHMQYKTELEEGYANGDDPSEKFIAKIEHFVDVGITPIILHHYPIGLASAKFMRNLSMWARSRGIDDRMLITPYIHTLSDMYSKKKLKQASGLLNGAVDLSICISNAVANDFTGMVGEIDVVPNGIDMDIYVPSTEDERMGMLADIGMSDKVKKVVCFSGRLSREKGIGTLQEILNSFNKSVDKRAKEVGFVIATPSIMCNEINLPSAFKKLKSFNRLISEDRLKFVLDISKYARGDSVSYEIYSRILNIVFGNDANSLKSMYGRMFGGVIATPVQRLADIAVQPSKSEAFGLAIVEAVASGAYLLASDVGGIREIVADESIGMLLPVEECGLHRRYVDLILGYERAAGDPGNEYRNCIQKFSDVEMAAKLRTITKKYIKQKREKKLEVMTSIKQMLGRMW